MPSLLRLDVNHPYTSLLAAFISWKLLILTIILFSPGRGYDTSTTVLPSFLDTPIPANFAQRALRHLSTRVVRWDAIYFTQIAQRGYVWEQEWAFGWSHTWILRVLGGFLAPWFGYGEVNTDVIAFGGVLLAHLCHWASVVVLYWLTNEVFKHEEVGKRRRLALLSALLYVLSPAGVFLSAPYAEAGFALLNFLGMYGFVKAVGAYDEDRGAKGAVLSLLIGGIFGLATTVRGNGLFSGVMLIAYALETGMRLLRRDDKWKTRLLRPLAIGASGILMAGIAFWPQILAYREYCLDAEAEVVRPWCTSRVPSIYAWVQKDNWGVGFLKYWTLSNLPLFLLASPVLTAMLLSCRWVAIRACETKGSNPTTAKDDSGRRQDRGANDGEAWRQMFYLCLPQLVLATLALTTYHVQIITRLSSGYPVWYWWLASAILDSHQRGPDVKSRTAKPLIIFVAVYSLIQTGLFASFMPPA